ncbi:hypothetical protein Tco_0064669 [Tanacetum coccineum]
MRQSRWMKLFSEYGFKAKYHLGKENVVVESWSRKKSEAKNEFWIDLWEASVLLGRKKGCVMDTFKFMAMPFGLTNALAVFMELMSRSKEEYSAVEDDRGDTEGREDVHEVFQQRGSYLDVEGIKWVSNWLVGVMKKNIASCGSKYLAYSRVEVEYQGSSGLLLQPELSE